MERQHSLDSLRGLLSLVVVAAHAWQIFGHPAYAAQDPASGFMGLAARVAVLFFFALSGFVITGSIQANIAANGRFVAERYVLARLFRIAPPLLVVIAGTALLAAVLEGAGLARVAAPAAARPVYVTNPAGQVMALASLATRGELTGAWLNGPLWSLSYELRMYVVSALLAVVLCTPGWLGRGAAGVLLWTYVSRIGLDTLPPGGLNLQAVSFAAFACGAVAYRFRAAPAGKLALVAVLFIAVAGLRLSQARGEVVNAMDTDPIVLAAQVALAGACAALVALVARGGNWPVFRRAGEYSYTLYIGHFPLLLALYFVTANLAPALVQGPLALLACAAAGLLSWGLLAKLGRWVERPGGQRRWASHWLARARTLSWGRAATGACLVAACGVPLTSSSVTPVTAELQLFGDSTQVQAHPLIAARFGPEVLNSAVNGTRSDMLLQGTDGLNPPWPRGVRARTVLINHGLNDARPWSRVPVETYKENLRRLAEAPVRVIFETPNPSTVPGRDTEVYAQAMKEVAAEFDIPVIDVHACFQQQPDWKARLYDGVHPDPQGVRHIVERCVAPALAPYLGRKAS